ncbi:MAG: ATP-binding protein [Candidatus Micrarchaeota archaeon]
MEKNQIIQILDRWNFWNKDIEVGIPRKDCLKELSRFTIIDKIISITGVRRAGKSTIIKQMVKNLIETEEARNNTLIINFEEPEFENVDARFLQRIYDAYIEIIKPIGKPFIFLDEVQNVRRWEKFVRSLNERKEAFIVVSGSSSQLSSEELATVLTGRQLYFEMFPLSFKEFLTFEFQEIKDRKDVLLNSQRIKILFRDYLKFGGFPEIVINKDAEVRVKILNGYYDDIINKDVVRRFKVRKIDKLRTISKFYLSNISSLMSFNKISRFLKLSTETIRRFSSYLETSNLMFFVKRFSFSLKEQENSPRKIYCIDVGLSNALGFRFSENFGKLAENIVAIALRRVQMKKNLEIYYWKENYEVDFIVKDGMKVKELIQVCWDITNYETREREIKSLLKALKKFKLKQGLIITEDFEGEEKINEVVIRFTPLWAWLISQELNREGLRI